MHRYSPIPLLDIYTKMVYYTGSCYYENLEVPPRRLRRTHYRPRSARLLVEGDGSHLSHPDISHGRYLHGDRVQTGIHGMH